MIELHWYSSHIIKVKSLTIFRLHYLSLEICWTIRMTYNFKHIVSIINQNLCLVIWKVRANVLKRLNQIYFNWFILPMNKYKAIQFLSKCKVDSKKKVKKWNKHIFIFIFIFIFLTTLLRYGQYMINCICLQWIIW